MKIYLMYTFYVMLSVYSEYESHLTEYKQTLLFNATRRGLSTFLTSAHLARMKESTFEVRAAIKGKSQSFELVRADEWIP
jgi:hypothetical protein